MRARYRRGVMLALAGVAAVSLAAPPAPPAPAAPAAASAQTPPASAQAPADAAQQPCYGFKWDVARETALFKGAGESLWAGRDVGSSVGLAVDRLYELHLTQQPQVSFALQPGRPTPATESYAGLATVEAPLQGDYRIAVDVPLWIDVVRAGALVAPVDFQGQNSCDGPHKIVEFDLSGGSRVVLQLSGSAKPVVRLSVTHAPPRKP